VATLVANWVIRMIKKQHLSVILIAALISGILTLSVTVFATQKSADIGQKPAVSELTAKAVRKHKPASWKIGSAAQPELRITGNVIRPDHPSQLFGFNINFRQFQVQLWSKEQKPKKGIVEALRPFEGAIYRYPGGSVANAFHWRESLGPLKSRAEQSSYYQKEPTRVVFGIDEYLKFVDDVSGTPWYVLNLVGTDLLEPMKLADDKEVAQSSVDLTKYLLANVDSKHFPLHIQLGNELDRSRFEWGSKGYAARAKAVTDEFKANELMKDINPVNFMRDFRWKYRRNKTMTDGKPRDFMAGVLNGLGETNDYSLHHYYDGDRLEGKSWSIPYWLRHLSNNINDHLALSGEPAQIWITEHGRQPRSYQPGKDGSKVSTSNIAAGISTADYLIALTQFAEVKGAVWHGLNAGPWQLFDYSVKDFDLSPRPIYWALRVLRKVSLEESLESFNRGPNSSNYAGGYDVRGAAFRSSDGKKMGIRVANRASKTHPFRIKYPEFANKKVEVMRYSISMSAGANPESKDDDYFVEMEPKPITGQFDKEGYLQLELQPLSVSSFAIQSVQ